ncbi:ABC transporter ATP-binding protein [Microbacterium sp. LWH7-1.2]|jgi:oligopeptide/dipeptide ABC transporter ATP-binding protein|uniref:ABC transporter ATP-binding protein n=1 Tax=Microbacterium sp. LWH7-1.2 TaxID=3135257 RepID=UPI003138B875
MTISLARGAESLLSVRDLRVEMRAKGNTTPILRGVNIDVKPGEALGIVGESGSGKSMTMRAIMRQLPAGMVASGRADFRNQSIFEMDRRQLVDFRARRVAMIHQDPRAHINPLWTVGDFLVEAVVATRAMPRRAATARALELLAEVGVQDPARRMSQYPSQLSGGLLQRVMIVAALMTEPQLILADEPTTALDVTVQAEVMSIFADITKTHGVGLVFITHDLDLAAAATDRIAVMYAGRIVEEGPSERVTEHPRHPYTAALLSSRPSAKVRRLPLSIPGVPASAATAGHGCAFADRCAFTISSCYATDPPLTEAATQQVSACIRSHELSPAIEGVNT